MIITCVILCNKALRYCCSRQETVHLCLDQLPLPIFNPQHFLEDYRQELLSISANYCYISVPVLDSFSVYNPPPLEETPALSSLQEPNLLRSLCQIAVFLRRG